MTLTYLSGNRVQGSSVASGGTIDGTGLKAYWKLAGNYTSNPQTETNVASTITGNNTLGTDADMIIHNSPTQVTSGTPSGLGNANSFDGSSDFGRAGDNADVGQWQFMHNTSGLFTMNWWFKFDDGEPPANEFIWDSSDATDSQPATRISTLASEEWRLMVTRTGGNNAVFDTNDASIDCEIPTDDAWHMYTMTWDYNNTPNFTYRVDGATSGTYYVTANKNGNYSAIDGNSDYAPYFMRSGYQASGGTGGTYGHIDGDVMEMSIWNRVLTNAEITHISASGN